MACNIGIAGITGRMGQLLAEEVPAAGASLSGGIGSGGVSGKPPPGGVALAANLSALAAASDVVIDFTHASAAQAAAVTMAASGKAWVLGTSGLSARRRGGCRGRRPRYPDRLCVQLLRRREPGAGIVRADGRSAAGRDLRRGNHGNASPAKGRRTSGTAVGMGRAVAKGRGQKLEDVMVSGRHGHTGARETGAIGFAALRGGQVVGEHTLIFASATEHIALTHRAFDRRAFRHRRGAGGTVGGGQAAWPVFDDGRSGHDMIRGHRRFCHALSSGLACHRGRGRRLRHLVSRRDVTPTDRVARDSANRETFQRLGLPAAHRPFCACN